MTPTYYVVIALAWIALLAMLAVFLWRRAWRASSRVGRGLMRGSVLLWSLALTLVAAETAFCAWYDGTDSFSQSNVSQRWFGRHVQVNPQGYRDRHSFTLAPPAKVRRISLLGDSFTLGHGIESADDRFGDILQQKCESAAPGRVEVYNFGKLGMTTQDHLLQLEAFARQEYRTDLVVLVYTLNDIEDLMPQARTMYAELKSAAPNSFLLRDTFLPNFLYLRWQVFSRPDVRNYFSWIGDAYRGATWERQQQRFDEMRRICDASGCRLWVVLFPLVHNLDGPNPLADAHQAVVDYWQRNHVPFLDLTETMHSHAGESLVVSRIDAHPNERAQQLAAEAMWQFVQAHQPELLREKVFAISDR
jgi:lysophospholipase L1-like esterase